MTRSREDLIRELAAQAAVPPGARSVVARALNWLLAAVLIAFLATLARAPLRDGAFALLLATPVTAAAFALGALVVLSASLAAFRSSVPSDTAPARQALWPLLWLAAWLMLLLVAARRGGPGVVAVHARAHCWLEVLAFAAPGLALGVVAVRKLWPLHGAWTGALLGLAAGATMALVMDLACNPDAGHSLLFHVLPGVALAAPGAALGTRLLKRP